MKLLIYGDIGGSGGYVRYCHGLLSSNAIPDNMDVFFITTPDFYKQIAPLDENRVKVITSNLPGSKFRLYRYFWYLMIYPKIVREITPDIEFYPAGRAKNYYNKTPYITACHNLLLFDENEAMPYQGTLFYKSLVKQRKYQSLSFKNASGTIFFSQYSKNYVCNLIPSIKNPTVIPHGLNEKFTITTERTFNFNTSIQILYVSPIFYYKHHKEVAIAIKKLRDATGLAINLKVIGSHNNEDAQCFRNFLKKENLDFVTITDFIDHKELITQYTNADIFVFASSCETFGITLLEAMGTGLPIACSNRCGLNEILRDGGTYFDPEDPSSIADALGKLISSNDLRKRLGKKAYQYSQEFTWGKSAQQTYAFICKILEQSRRQQMFNG